MCHFVKIKMHIFDLTYSYLLLGLYRHNFDYLVKKTQLITKQGDEIFTEPTDPFATGLVSFHSCWLLRGDSCTIYMYHTRVLHVSCLSLAAPKGHNHFGLKIFDKMVAPRQFPMGIKALSKSVEWQHGQIGTYS